VGAAAGAAAGVGAAATGAAGFTGAGGSDLLQATNANAAIPINNDLMVTSWLEAYAYARY
jgi:hypothetical protein